MTARIGLPRVVAAVDKTALALGLRPGLGMAHAQALVPGLNIVEAAPEADDEALTRLARWCSRYAPVVAPNPPDGIWIDIAGAAHLLGGEEALLADLVGRLEHRGIAARAAVADAPGTAWAVARYGAEPVVPPGRGVDVISRLPIQALRLPAATIQALGRLGIERVGELAAKPRAPMTRRFGTEVALRLDQALGHAFEPINPLVPHETPSKRMAFAEPVSHLDDLKRALAHLAAALCVDLAREGAGVRRLDLIFRRVDRKSEALRIGTAQPSRDAAIWRSCSTSACRLSIPGSASTRPS